MENLTADRLTERLTDLDRRKREGLRAKIAAEGNLAREQNDLRTAEASRKTYVEFLGNHENDAAMTGYLENEIDRLDAEITSHKRLIESYSAALARVTADLDQVRVEWNALDREVEERERAEKFEVGKSRIAKKLADAGDVLDNARLILGDTVMDMFHFSEEFGPAALQFLRAEAEKFFSRQNGVVNRFKQVWGWNGGQFSWVIVPSQKISQ
jgi:chromosome segregation ATPase